jgi:hypothetical protein
MVYGQLNPEEIEDAGVLKVAHMDIWHGKVAGNWCTVMVRK